jgi:hypothetical protein
MVTLIKKGTSIKEKLKQIEEVAKRKLKGLNASKYSGVLKNKIDPIQYQQESRNEWN